MKGIRISAAAGVLLSVAGSAFAITVAGFDPNSSSFVATALTAGGTYSGVAELLIVRSDLGYGVVEGCSGALLADGISILTSAHCIADANGVAQATAAYVTFTTSNGTYTTQAMSFHVDPSYNGSATSPSDVAVLTLTSPAPNTVERYNLYTGDPFDQVMSLAGYGFGGTGATGYDPIDYPFGTLRAGENQYVPDAGTDDLMFDFDDPAAVQDTSAPSGDPPYTSGDEAFIAPGDTGGPSFIDGEIAGLHSYVTGNSLNSSFGEIAADASVAYNLTFIQSAMVGAPEPRLMILLGIALVAVSLAGNQRKHN